MKTIDFIFRFLLHNKSEVLNMKNKLNYIRNARMMRLLLTPLPNTIPLE